MEKTFEEILAACAAGSLTIHADSRKVQKGGVFVAIPGADVNGEEFVANALENGAAYIVCRPDASGLLPPESRRRIIPHDDPREALWRLAQARWHTADSPLKIIAVTGTNGKTTSAFLLEHIFKSAGCKTGVLGTINYHWEGHSIPAPLTTPDPLTLHSTLAEMAGSGVEVAIMEASSHALAQQRVCGLPFAGALFTNLTQDHLDFHKNMESYFRAKALLFTRLPRADKAMAIDGDDSYGRRLLELLPSAVSFGTHAGMPGKRHLWGHIQASTRSGLNMRMEFEGRQWEINSPLVGEFNARNLLGVQALALQLGIEPGQFACLDNFNGVCGRLERVPNAAGLNIFVDYAHTPDALENVLQALRGAGFKRIITVFGCGGNRDRSKRPLMGMAVARHSDVAILTSDNPRFEDPEKIMQDVKPGLAKAPSVFMEVDRKKATGLGIGMLAPEDALLIAGKGHEDYQIIAGTKIHYSDQEVVRELTSCA